MADTMVGIGTEGQQLARLSHMVEEHGFAVLPCPVCHDADGGCEACDHVGVVFLKGRFEPCGSACPMNDVRPV